ncbi:hypothetical protein SC127_11955 [Pantoea sp. T14]
MDTFTQSRSYPSYFVLQKCGLRRFPSYNMIAVAGDSSLANCL